ncbi:cysteine proteinases superfamily protein isoform X2 [Wolffia australiana]
MGFPKPNDKVLSFGDVVLRNSDLEILRGPHYINDRIIEFCFADISINLSDDIVLVPPSISFWIANCAGHDSLEDAINPLELPDDASQPQITMEFCYCYPSEEYVNCCIVAMDCEAREIWSKSQGRGRLP